MPMRVYQLPLADPRVCPRCSAVTDSTGLALTRLTLTNFRNYSGLRLDVSARLVALSGPNGAGKTNLLEAISLLTPGRGLARRQFR